MSSDKSPDASIPDAVLQQVLYLLQPAVRLLLQHGVDHPRLASALKRVFVDEALAELARRDHKATITAVGLLAGLQRRDVKALLAQQAHELPPKAKSPTLAMQVMTRWANEARFLDEEGHPRRLPMRSADPEQPTFEQLTDEVSKDVHPPAVLDELVRLGLATVDHGEAALTSSSFVPTNDFNQMLGALSRNVHDHLAAAATNVVERRQRFAEYSLFADELRPESADELQELTRKLWRSAYRRSVAAATDLIARDKTQGFTAEAPEMRVRFGVYFYAEPKESPAPAVPATDVPAPDVPPGNDEGAA